MHYAIIFNPRAGFGRPQKKRSMVERAMRRAGLSYDLYHTARPGHAVELAVQLAPRYDALLAAGGDGTVQEVGAGLVGVSSRVPLGVLPLGTGNDFLKMTGIPGSVEPAAASLRGAVPVAVDVGQVRGKEEGGDRFDRLFVNVLGVGFDAEVAQAVQSYKMLRGKAAYLAAVLAVLRRRSVPLVRVAVENGEEETAYYEGPLFLAALGNGRSSGGGFYLTPEADLRDGKLDLCLIEALPLRRIARLIPAVLRGRHLRAPEVHFERVRRMRLFAESSLSVHADGEVVTRSARQVDVEVVPQRLHVLMSRRRASASGRL